VPPFPENAIIVIPARIIDETKRITVISSSKSGLHLNH
jgi:hypothetical protein